MDDSEATLRDRLIAGLRAERQRLETELIAREADLTVLYRDNDQMREVVADLLGALQLIANFGNEDVSDMVRDIARAAIAKAEGAS